MGIILSHAAIADPLPLGQCSGPVGTGVATVTIEGTRPDGLPIGKAAFMGTGMAKPFEASFGTNFNGADKKKVDLFRADGTLWYSGLSMDGNKLTGYWRAPNGANSIYFSLPCSAQQK
jgi:hypothetical protein